MLSIDTDDFFSYIDSNPELKELLNDKLKLVIKSVDNVKIAEEVTKAIKDIVKNYLENDFEIGEWLCESMSEKMGSIITDSFDLKAVPKESGK